MTFQTYLQTVLGAVFPEGRAENLETRYRNAVIDGMIDVQRKVRCLRESHCSSTTAENAYDSCNASAVPMIVGTLTKVYIAKAANACDFFIPDYIKPDVFNSVVRDTSSCYSSAYALLDAATEPPPTSRAAVACSTTAVLRPVLAESTRCVGYYTFDRDVIRVYPPLVAGEAVVIQWNGIKKDWQDGEDVGPRLGMRDVMKAVELFVEADSERFAAKDIKQAGGAIALYNLQVSDLIYTCRRNGFPVPLLENPYSGGFSSVSTPAPILDIYYGKDASQDATAGVIGSMATTGHSSRFITVTFPETGLSQFGYISIPFNFGVGVMPNGFVIGEGVGTPIPMATPQDTKPYGSETLNGYWFETMVFDNIQYRTFRTSMAYFGDFTIEIR